MITKFTHRSPVRLQEMVTHRVNEINLLMEQAWEASTLGVKIDIVLNNERQQYISLPELRPSKPQDAPDHPRLMIRFLKEL